MDESAQLAPGFFELAAPTKHTAFQEHSLLVTCLSFSSFGTVVFLHQIQPTSLDTEIPGGTCIHGWSKDVPDEVTHHSGLRKSPKISEALSAW